MSKRSPRSTRRTHAAVSSTTLDAIFGALAHPARRQILIILHARGGTMTAGEIADRFKHSWPTTTRHLSVLEEAGLLEIGKQGRNRFYSLRMRDLGRAGNWLDSWAGHPPAGRPGWAQRPYATMRNAIAPNKPKH